MQILEGIPFFKATNNPKTTKSLSRSQLGASRWHFSHFKRDLCMMITTVGVYLHIAVLVTQIHFQGHGTICEIYFFFWFWIWVSRAHLFVLFSDEATSRGRLHIPFDHILGQFCLPCSLWTHGGKKENVAIIWWLGGGGGWWWWWRWWWWWW